MQSPPPPVPDRYAPRRRGGQGSVVLGIETSCDETAAAVVVRAPDGGGRILSNVVRAQWEQHRRYGGVVPELAARAHVDCLDEIIAAALSEAGLGFGDLDAVAVTAGPGLIGGLLVGVTTAKAIALVHDLALVAVNHLEAHALTVGLTEGLRPPYLVLLVSGGHTQLLIVHEAGRYERLGTTIDDALGEAFDKTAKLLGLGFPGGPAVERAAATGTAGRFTLPRPMLGRAEPHFSFAGLKTAVRQQAQARAPLSPADIADLCAEFEAAVADSVSDRVRRALALARERLGHAPLHLVVAGGRGGQCEAARSAGCRRSLGRLCAAHPAGGAVYGQCGHGGVGGRGAPRPRLGGRPRLRSPRALATRSRGQARARRRASRREGLSSILTLLVRLSPGLQTVQ
jgi:N6-L-threonylcarbamoyladenine synthase